VIRVQWEDDQTGGMRQGVILQQATVFCSLEVMEGGSFKRVTLDRSALLILHAGFAAMLRDLPDVPRSEVG
jgi:hypothetical protein